jgi:hypothetical protein
MPNITLITDDGDKEITVKDNVAYFDDGTIVPDHLLKGFKSVLFTQTPVYNAKFISDLTSTPYHFWRYASDETKDKTLRIFEKTKSELMEIRDQELKKTFAKRVKRMNNVRAKKS